MHSDPNFYAVGGFLAGLITTGSFKGALIGGLTGAAFGGVHGFFANTSGTAANLGLVKSVGHFASKGVAQLTNLGRVVKTFAHGVVGGLSSKLSGGSFSKSFLSTAFVQAFAPGIDNLGGGMTNRGLVAVSQRVGTAALLGGIASKIVGGSFSMGARLGAMSRFFNDEGGITTVKDFLKGVGHGVKSFFVGVGRGLRQAGRTYGFLGDNEYYRAKYDASRLDQIVEAGVDNPDLVSDAVRNELSNMDAYDIGRTAGRTAVGVVLPPIGIAAAIGDALTAVENGNYAYEELLKSILQGYD